MEAPKVYVLVINWNGREHLQECFASLLASDYPALSAILLDNASTDGSTDLFDAQFGGDSRTACWRCPENLGWGGGNNFGIARALEQGADFVFLLNNDTAIAPDAIRLLVEHAERAPDAAALAPRMLLFDTPSVLNSVGLRLSPVGAAWDIGIGRADSPAWHEDREVAGVCGGAMFLRADALRQTGPFAAEFGIYYDDLELCLRLWNAGWRCLSSPAAAVRHKFSATLGQASERKHYLNERNRWRCILLSWPTGLIARSLPGLVRAECRVLGAALRDGRWAHAAAQARGWGSNLVFLPAALTQRRALARSGMLQGAFARLVEPTPVFCPEVVLPERGWYPPIRFQEACWHPMAPQAYLPPAPGKLSISVANCYCPGAALTVSISTADEAAVNISTGETVEFDASQGATLDARQLVERERSGLHYDAGAWLRVVRAGQEVDPRAAWKEFHGRA